MKRAIGLIIVGGLLLWVAYQFAASALDLRGGYDPVALARADVELARLQREAEAAAFWAPVWAAAWNTAGIVAVFGALCYAGALGVAHVARFREERRPDDAGRLPVLRRDLPDVAARALDAFHGARIAEAQRQPTPHSVHYAPNYRADGRGGSEPAVLPADVAPVAPGLPGVTDLADVRHTPTAQSILLGLGEGGAPVAVPMRSLWHVALAGPTGGGKSNIARMVVAQLQSLGAQVVIGDPKWTQYDAEADEDWRPIEARLAREPAYTPKDIGHLLTWGTAELERRLAMRRAGQPIRSAVFLYLDELPWIAQHVPEAAARVGELVRVGRGVGVFLLAGAQDLLVSSVGISGARDQFRTGFYLGGDRKTGSILLDLPQREVAEPEGVGLAWLRSAATTPPQQVRVPYCSNRAVYKLLGDGSADRFDLRKPAGSHAVAAGSQATGEASSASVSFEASRAFLLFQQGADVAQIVKELSGVQASEGRRYQAESARVQGLIRDAMKGGMA